MKRQTGSRSVMGSSPTPDLLARRQYARCGLYAAVVFLALCAAAHATPTPTPPITRKPTSTERPTRTPDQACWLPPAGSKDVAALTVTNANNVSQRYDLTGSTSPNSVEVLIAPHGISSRTLKCEVGGIEPVFVHFVNGTNDIAGWLCVLGDPQACKRKGKLDCVGGDDLGFLTTGDANIGSCSTVKACKKACSQYCKNVDLKRYGAACTDEICKCRCIDREAGSAAGPGDAQCYLGVDIMLKTSNGCRDDSAPLVDFGSRCFPMTTSSTLADVLHADSSMSEIGPLLESGQALPLTCDEALTSDMRTGLVMNGQIPVIFGTAPSDLILSLHMPCGPTPPTPPSPTPTQTP